MTGAGMPGMGAGGGGQPAAQPVAQAESPADFTEQVRSRDIYLSFSCLFRDN